MEKKTRNKLTKFIFWYAHTHIYIYVYSIPTIKIMTHPNYKVNMGCAIQNWYQVMGPGGHMDIDIAQAPWYHGIMVGLPMARFQMVLTYSNDPMPIVNQC